MVKFTSEQAIAVIEIQQLVNEWAYLELDLNNGRNMGALVTEDCRYAGHSGMFEGRDAIEGYYRERVERLAAQSDELPQMRHLNANLCVRFSGADDAAVNFSLLFFTTEGSGSANPDPVAVADVRMECRREADREWRIARSENSQPFHRG